ncbi:MAG: hypothetical protein PUC02_01185, partial [Bacteroidales bacterium]|nr:hypothetical protein [Bacteroidales bacterium]
TSQACGLAIGIPLRVYTVPFCSNVYSINVHLLAFIVLCYPHAFASDPVFEAKRLKTLSKNAYFLFDF